MYKYCRLFFVVLQFIIVLPVFAHSNAGSTSGLLHIRFGENGLIVYDLKTGLINVYKNNVAVFSNAYTEVKVGNKLISSKDYNNRIYI